ncbi:glycosyltransferase family 4 protein [Geodermatophilus ruber]|uniref:Glycosyltransferase involved in cell wall bisynthesis n=1 Tax=Geodermatophilus ruber TaxID=504800 RepID=A0A1I4DIT6_9ACTN|nr:glycosyltransferase family 4 protein [Geodermatophilus ruber]SFK92799.1 Glycosyltransferase involved in cell wall bisynthesis [Geodermatophilus ruber]
MRLVYLHQYFVTPEMSGGTRSYEWASRLAARGHDVHVVTSDQAEGARRRVTVEGGAQVHWIPVRYDNSMSVPRRMLAFVQFAVMASWTARRLRGDVVLATSTPLTIAIPALAARWGRPTPMVFEVRDLWPDVPIAMGGLRNPVLQRAARLLERAAYRHATRVIALSPEMTAGVVRAGFPAEAITLVPNASDVALFRRPGVEAEARRFRAAHEWLGDRPLVLYAGTLGRANDIPWLVDVAAATAPLAPEVRFLIVGEGAEKQKVTALAERRGVLGRSLFLLPAQPKEAMPGILAAATISTSLVADIPALAGNSANKVFDAFAAGRPVALNAQGSLGGLLEGTGAGLVLDRDPRVAAKQLAGFLADPAAVARAGAASRELADKVFARDVLFAGFERAVADAYREGRVVRTLRRPTAVPPEPQARAQWGVLAGIDEVTGWTSS